MLSSRESSQPRIEPRSAALQADSLPSEPLSSGKESSCNVGDAWDGDLILGLGRSPGVVNGNLLQYSCLGNPLDRGPWWATVHGVTKSWTWLSDRAQLICLFSVVLHLRCCAGLSLVVVSCGTKASHCGGFSCWREKALEHRLNSCGAGA